MTGLSGRVHGDDPGEVNLESTRVVGVDLGSKRIGIALSDPTRTVASPHVVIQRAADQGLDHEAIVAIARETGATTIVVGLPLMTDGSRGIQGDKAEAFVEQLRRYTQLPIHMQDERYSTSEVEDLLISAGRCREERKKIIDSAAASIILQRFMDRRKQGAA